MSIATTGATKRLFAKGTISEDRKMMIQANKLNFAGHEQELQDRLTKLDLLELTNYLVWIPITRFGSIENLGNGGYCKVYSGTIEWSNGFVKQSLYSLRRENVRICKKYALKEITSSMANELLLATHISYHVFSSVASHITMPVIGLSYNPSTNNYLMVMDCADNNMETHPLNFESWTDFVVAAIELTKGIMVVHDLGVLHHDLHPGNVVFKGKYRELRIIDIGLGGTIERIHDSGGVYGRLAYLPPEVIQGQPYTQASDIYCLGTLLWQLLTGVPPRGIALSKRQLREELIPDMPKELERMFRGCWHPNPAKRPSARTLYGRLSTTGLLKDPMTVEPTPPQTQNLLSNNSKAFIAIRRQQHAAERALHATEKSYPGLGAESHSQFYKFDLLRRIGEMAQAENTMFHAYSSLARICSLVESELDAEKGLGETSSRTALVSSYIKGENAPNRISVVSQRGLSWLTQKPTPSLRSQ